MKKLLFVLLTFSAILFLARCDYDDSNDIDILKPNDSTKTGVELHDISKV